MLGTTKLNKQQLEAITYDGQALLIVAGAGSGKTTVLANRAAFLFQNNLTTPYSLMALTFTNKAAKEMKNRIETISEISTEHSYIGTFHSIFRKILQINYEVAGLDRNFTIIDTDDKTRLIKNILKELNENYEEDTKLISYFISKQKENVIRPNQSSHDDKLLLEVYRIYTQRCIQQNLLDFEEILLKAYELLRDNESVRRYYQERFNHIFIDEFQDTNFIQYKIIKLLATEGVNITAVGDDDQSIYSWRGAIVDYMLDFAKDFPNCKIIKLEQNYRSTNNILNAANHVIKNNSTRLNGGKNLWSQSSDGDLIAVYPAFNEYSEADYVSEKIYSFISEKKIPLNNIAIMYRINYLSRVLETSLNKKGIPYKIFGGFRFFERLEIKNAVAYLRLINNYDDDLSFERIINFPTRGIGKISLQKLREYSRENSISLFNTIPLILENNLLSPKIANTLLGFYEKITHLKSTLNDVNFSDWVNDVFTQLGLYDEYTKKRS